MSVPPGAYGFSFHGIEGPLLAECPPDWPQIEIRQRQEAPHPVTRAFTDTRVEFPLIDGGSVVIDRDPARGTYRVPDILSGEELAHPYLVPVAAVHAYWADYETFHAGGFVADGRVWAILASREGGKSSLLAALCTAGFGIVSDDLIVTGHGQVFAGPRSIDLRRDAVPHFPGTRSLGMTGQRPRWRLDPGEVAPELPLGGWLMLAWGDTAQAQRVEPKARISRLAASRALKGPVRNPRQLLTLAARPMWIVTRPRGWDRMGQVLDLIQTTISR